MRCLLKRAQQFTFPCWPHEGAPDPLPHQPPRFKMKENFFVAYPEKKSTNKPSFEKQPLTAGYKYPLGRALMEVPGESSLIVRLKMSFSSNDH